MNRTIENIPATLADVVDLFYWVILGVADNTQSTANGLELQMDSLAKFFHETAKDMPDEQVKLALEKLAQYFVPGVGIE